MIKIVYRNIKGEGINGINPSNRIYSLSSSSMDYLLFLVSCAIFLLFASESYIRKGANGQWEVAIGGTFFWIFILLCVVLIIKEAQDRRRLLSKMSKKVEGMRVVRSYVSITDDLFSFGIEGGLDIRCSWNSIIRTDIRHKYIIIYIAHLGEVKINIDCFSRQEIEYIRNRENALSKNKNRPIYDDNNKP